MDLFDVKLPSTNDRSFEAKKTLNSAKEQAKSFADLQKEEARKEAEVRAYEAQMMSFLADARANGRENEYKDEMKKVKELREKAKASEKLKDRKRAEAARFGKGKKIPR